MTAGLTYHFVGNLIPERAQLPFYQTGARVTCDLFRGRIMTTIDCSQIAVLLETESAVADLPSLRNYVMDVVRLDVSALGFVHGCGYDFELSQVFDPVQRVWVLFGVSEPSLNNRYPDRDQELRRLLFASSGPRSTYLRLCLADLNSAIRRPGDTAFFCYRAIESLKQFFADLEGEHDRSKQWELLRKRLDLREDELSRVKKLADVRRHGNTTALSYGDRSAAIALGWRCVDRFLQWVEANASLFLESPVGTEAT
jgi:hypothetical protein